MVDLRDNILSTLSRASLATSKDIEGMNIALDTAKTYMEQTPPPDENPLFKPLHHRKII